MSDLDSVHHQHQQIKLIEPAAELFAQLAAHARDQVAARRTLTRSAHAYTIWYWLQAVAVAAGRDPKQNLIEDPCRNRIDSAEVERTFQLRLAATHRSYSWTGNCYPLAAEGQHDRCCSPTIMRALRAMLALSSCHLHHIKFEQLLKRVYSNLLNPSEQLATAVDDPFNHRQQQLTVLWATD